MLGEACDFKCRHCVQHPAHNHLKKHPSNTCIKYIQHLADIRPKGLKRIRSTIDLVFFGGEPLLYWDTIKEVVEKLDRDNIRYTVISNGSRLTQEMVDYLNEHDICFALSNDGRQTTKVRDRNLLEDGVFLSLFSQIKKKSIATTVHAYNQDLYDLWAYLDEKVGDLPITYEFLVLNWSMPKDIYEYDYPKWEQTCKQIKENLIKAYKETEGNIGHLREAQLFSNQIQRCFRFLDGKAEFPFCGSYRQTVNIDLDGNHYLCHNGFQKFASCEMPGTKVAKEAAMHFTALRVIQNKPCQDCEALPFCHEGCPFSCWSERQAYQCKFRQILARYVKEFMNEVEAFHTTEVEL